MKRLPAIAFAALVAATIFAFFITQALKSKDPVVWGPPIPRPAAFDPIDGTHCYTLSHQLLDYRSTQLKVKLPEANTVAVLVIDSGGQVVATLSSGTRLAANQSHVFTWNGYEDDGQVAPDGDYYFTIDLLDNGRSVNLAAPVTIITHPPHPKIESVTLTGTGTTTATTTTPTATTAGAGSSAVVITPPHASVTIRFKDRDYRRDWLYIYRTDVTGKPRRVDKITPKLGSGVATWDGDDTAGNPVPAGTYLVQIVAQDQACNLARSPVTLPPSPGTTPHSGVTVRYLAATAPLTPTAAGGRATVTVDAPVGAFTWQLRRVGTSKVLRHGSGPAGGSQLGVRLPRGNAGLYWLTLSAGGHTTQVPLVAYATAARQATARVLVALPMLTWQGANTVDDDGDGLPDTLAAGDSIRLDRPFASSPLAAVRQDAALLNYLDSHHVAYQLTTDIALAQGAGPSLVDRWGVVLAGPENWLPSSEDPTHSLATTLKGFVDGGGRVLSLGTGALQGSSVISGYPADPVAAAPVTSGKDLFGAQHGPLTSTGGDLITELADQLGILSSVPAFTGFNAYEPIEPPAGVEVSAAGIADGAPAVVAFKHDQGYVIEVGLANFNLSLAGNVDAQELLTSVWQLLAKK